MGRKKGSTVPPEVRALEIIDLGKPVTPTQINEYIGIGNYASKYISLLKDRGYIFTTQKEGKRVVSYTLMGEPEHSDAIRNNESVVIETADCVVNIAEALADIDLEDDDEEGEIELVENEEDFDEGTEAIVRHYSEVAQKTRKDDEY